MTPFTTLEGLISTLFRPSQPPPPNPPSKMQRGAPEPLRHFWRATLTWPSEKKSFSGAAPQRDIISYDSCDGFGDRIWDIMKFQIQKNIKFLCDQLSH